ncbi:MAG: hypothetical protein O7E57_02205 [Gammaproteobacteria bacterium]|nr:hypothetical protein [Gammaproteobacteria bacterium]
MSPAVQRLASQGTVARVRVIAAYNSHPQRAQVDRILELGGEIHRHYSSLGMLALDVPINGLGELSLSEDLNFLSLDAPVEAASVSGRLTANIPLPGTADFVAPSPEVVVAVLDSGIANHYDLDVTGHIDIITPIDSCPGDYADQVGTAGWLGSDGSRPWMTSWVEMGETDGPDAGMVQVATGAQCSSGNCFQIGALTGSDFGLERPVDLLGAATATLNYDYMAGDLGVGGIVNVNVSSDGGNTWTTLTSHDSSAGQGVASFDISPYVSANTWIRFDVSGDSAMFYLDNVAIEHSAPAKNTAYLAGLGDGTDVPFAALTSRQPNAEELANMDPERNLAEGLTISRGGSLYSTDPATSQVWVADASDLTLNGKVSLQLWSAMVDFSTSSGATVTAYLIDTDVEGGDMIELASATVSRPIWDTEALAEFIDDTFDFGHVYHLFTTERKLGV